MMVKQMVNTCICTLYNTYTEPGRGSLLIDVILADERTSSCEKEAFHSALLVLSDEDYQVFFPKDTVASFYL